MTPRSLSWRTSFLGALLHFCIYQLSPSPEPMLPRQLDIARKPQAADCKQPVEPAGESNPGLFWIPGTGYGVVFSRSDISTGFTDTSGNPRSLNLDNSPYSAA